MKILVTGGSGYLGTHVRNYLGADDFSRRADLDMLNLQDVHKAEEYDVVIHLAAQLDKSPDSAEEVFLNNVEGTVNILRRMREDSVFIFASTKDVYGRFADNHRVVPESCETLYSGQSALEWSKLIAEKYVAYYAHANRFRSCIFRLSTVYAPPTIGNKPSFVTHFAEMIREARPLRLPGGGTPVRDILHVDDFSRACQSFMDSVIRHGIYNLGGGPDNALSLKELVAKIAELADAELAIDEENPLPAPVPTNYVSDLSLIGQELAFQPSIGIDEGLRTLID